MEKTLQIREDEKDIYLSTIHTITEFTRITTRINRNHSGYLIRVQGNETEIDQFIEELNNKLSP